MHTLVSKSRACSSLRVGYVVVCLLLCIMVGRGHSNWRKLLWRSVSLTGTVNKFRRLRVQNHGLFKVL